MMCLFANYIVPRVTKNYAFLSYVKTGSLHKPHTLLLQYLYKAGSMQLAVAVWLYLGLNEENPGRPQLIVQNHPRTIVL